MATYELHPEVWEDIRELWEFIAQDDPAAADRVENELFRKFELLSNNPSLGHPRPDLTDGSLLFSVVRQYLVAYDPGVAPLLILMVIHGARRPQAIAEFLTAR